MPESPAQPSAPLPAVALFAVQWRVAAAFVAGLALHAIFFFRFLPYARRPLPGLPGLALLIVVMAAAAFALARQAPRGRALIPLATTAALVAAQAVTIVVDCSKSPGSHDRWPLEIAMMLVWSLPAWAGAALARVAHRQAGRA